MAQLVWGWDAKREEDAGLRCGAVVWGREAKRDRSVTATTRNCSALPLGGEQRGGRRGYQMSKAPKEEAERQIDFWLNLMGSWYVEDVANASVQTQARRISLPVPGLPGTQQQDGSIMQSPAHVHSHLNLHPNTLTNKRR